MGDANQLVWYEQRPDMDPAWIRQTVDNLAGAVSVVAADVDGDSETDLVATGTEANALYWYENALAGPAGDWLPHEIDGQLPDSVPRKNPTRGGSSEIETKEPIATPTSRSP